ncbi:HpcH/HpaI aldolase/citrate lyase family protein [Chloroflexota bacterium]
MSVIPQNLVKHALRKGQSVVGTMIVELHQPAVAQLLVNAGFDFVIIDNEHGPFNIETIANLTRAARHLGLTPIVRVPDLTYPHIAQTLDAGAQGLMIPRIMNAQQVREVLQIMKFPPQGIRGNALSRGYTDFKSGPVDEAMAQTNEETMLIVQIENQSAVENIEEIVTIPGVDVALIGPNDLSISLGIPGKIDAPQMHDAIQKTIHACQRYDVVPGIHINDLNLAAYWAKQGMRLISARAEIVFLVNGGREVVEAIGQAFEK